MRSKITQRLFLVGCPRSGTTLLQAMLAAHSQIASFPETNLFAYLLPVKHRWLAAAGIASPVIRRWYDRAKDLLNIESAEYPAPKPGLLACEWARASLRMLDDHALKQNKTQWLEKTPHHLYCISTIEHYVSSARFIHIVRNGPDTVASLYDVTHKHPEKWYGAWDIEQCVSRWLQDVRITLQYYGEPGHTVVRYEDLVADPRSTLMGLCQALQIAFQESMLTDYRDNVEKVATKEEAWKRNVSKSIYNANSTKFYELFDKAQQQYILTRTSEVDLERLCRK